MVICYDGSDEAVEAIRYAAEIFPGAAALIVTVWRPVIDELVSASGVPGPRPPVSEPTDTNARQRLVAHRLASEGARLASEAGLDAEPAGIPMDEPAWEAIEEVADERNAWLIVCGNRRSGVVAALPMNLGAALVIYASRPVLSVPGTKAAAARRKVREKSREKSREKGRH
jgi:nucleotide-binding universal stress UspA family protein